MSRPTKIEVNCTTGVETITELNDEEIAQLELDRIAFQEKQDELKAQAEALAAIKVSARAKLVAGEPLSEEEAATIVL
jgi:hypothetical protein